jgi:hypothetical protein
MPGRTPAQRDGVYRLILALMLADIVVGVGLVLLGALVIDERALVIAGAGLALIGFVLFLFFRRLGARAGG